MPGSYEVKHFDEWQEFRCFIEDEFAYNKRFVFRGHRDATWHLQTTLDRLIKQLPEDFQAEKIIENHLKRFKKALRGRRGSNPSPPNG